MRPNNLDEFIGQEPIKKIIQAEIKTDGQFRHTLLLGEPGLGKTTLAGVLANALGYQVSYYTASAGMDAKMITRMFLDLSITGYNRGGIPTPNAVKHLVFIDEFHAIKDYEAWLAPLEDRQIYHDGGVSWLPCFTLVGATNHIYKLPPPLVDRMGLQLMLEPYNNAELAMMIKRIHPDIKDEIAIAIANRSRGTARIALSYAQSVKNFGGLEFFDVMGINDEGCTNLDRKVIDALIAAKGKSVSLPALAAMVQSSPKVIQETIEPYLLRIGKIEITSKGRTVKETTRGGLIS